MNEWMADGWMGERMDGLISWMKGRTYKGSDRTMNIWGDG